MGKFRIDKSNFTPEQLAQWEELLEIGKSVVDPAANQEEVEEETPPAAPKKPAKKGEEEPVETKKSATPAEPEVPDFVKAAIAKSEEFIEQQNKKEMTEVAKKYAILGQEPEKLGEQLYDLKKNNEAMYNTCISMLDGQLALIEKSGVFAEIGKSGHGGSGTGSAESKIDAAAHTIMKSDPNMTYEAAVAKACTDDPSLMAEYDAEYFGY